MIYHLGKGKHGLKMKDWIIKKDQNRASRGNPDLQIFRNSFLAMLEKEGAHPHPLKSFYNTQLGFKLMSQI
jgi:hypothetical protein